MFKIRKIKYKKTTPEVTTSITAYRSIQKCVCVANNPKHRLPHKILAPKF